VLHGLWTQSLVCDRNASLAAHDAGEERAGAARSHAAVEVDAIVVRQRSALTSSRISVIPVRKTIPASTPAAYVESLSGGQRSYVEALRGAVVAAVPQLAETVKWGHLVYLANGPVLLIRAEKHRVLFGFWRGKSLRHIEPRLRPGGKYDMATLELVEGTALDRECVVRLASEAVALNVTLGNPTAVAGARRRIAG